MSKKINKTIKCPECGKEENVTLWSVINKKDFPKARDEIMLETLFDYKCTNCGYSAQLLTRTLYNDEQNNFMILLVPDFNEEVLNDLSVEEKYPEFKNVRKRIVPNLNRLKEKILIFETGFNDLTMEMAKLAVSKIIEQKFQKTVNTAYFIAMDNQTNQLTFTFFLDGVDEPVKYDTKADVYNMADKIIREYAIREESSKYFLNIDAKWAKKILSTYKNA